MSLITQFSASLFGCGAPLFANIASLFCNIARLFANSVVHARHIVIAPTIGEGKMTSFGRKQGFYPPPTHFYSD